MPPKLPGFCWDEEKQRYFKIQARHQAPADSAWSKENVRQREQAQDRKQEIKRRRLQQRGRIVRSRALDDPLLGGSFRASCGIRSDRNLASHYVGGDMGAAVFAQSLAFKGEVKMVLDDSKHHSNCIYVNGSDEKSGVGFVYAESSGSVAGHYLIREESTDALDLRPNTAHGMPIVPSVGGAREPPFCPEMTSLKYHPTSSYIMVTSRSTETGVAHRDPIQIFSPALSEPSSGLAPAWRLGDCDHYTSIDAPYAINACAVAPPSATSSLHMVFATSSGITTYGPFQEQFVLRDILGNNEFFAVDFLDQDPNLVLSGGRTPALFLHDMRVAATTNPDPVLRVATAGPTAHVRSAGGTAVVAAGPGNRMALYDIRYVSAPQLDESVPASKVSKNTYKHRPSSRPVLTFSDYSNAAHICNIGFDILPNPGRGLVAAATDRGEVGLWSLRSGRRLVEDVLKTETVEVRHKHEKLAWPQGAENVSMPVKANTPIRALQWEKLPRDEHESLFVGVWQRVKKFSFDRDLEEEEAFALPGSR